VYIRSGQAFFTVSLPARIVKRSDLVGVNLPTILPAPSDKLLAFGFAIVHAVNSPLRSVLLLSAVGLLRDPEDRIHDDRCCCQVSDGSVPRRPPLTNDERSFPAILAWKTLRFCCDNMPRARPSKASIICSIAERQNEVSPSVFSGVSQWRQVASDEPIRSPDHDLGVLLEY